MDTRTNTYSTSASRKTFLSSDPQKAIQEMMETIDRMRNVYELETDALENLDTKAFLSLQNEKLQTTNIYKSGIEDILARKDEMKKIDPAIKKELERMQADFTELSAKNMSALKRMQRTMERLGNTVQKVAKESVKKQRVFSYGESGKLHSDDDKRVSIGVSETA